MWKCVIYQISKFSVNTIFKVKYQHRKLIEAETKLKRKETHNKSNGQHYWGKMKVDCWITGLLVGFSFILSGKFVLSACRFSVVDFLAVSFVWTKAINRRGGLCGFRISTWMTSISDQMINMLRRFPIERPSIRRGFSLFQNRQPTKKTALQPQCLARLNGGRCTEGISIIISVFAFCNTMQKSKTLNKQHLQQIVKLSLNSVAQTMRRATISEWLPQKQMANWKATQPKCKMHTFIVLVQTQSWKVHPHNDCTATTTTTTERANSWLTVWLTVYLGQVDTDEQ